MPGITTSIVIAGAGVVVAVATARADKRRRVAMLRHVGERRSGTLDTGGLFGNPQLHIRFHDGVELTISMWSARHGRYTEYNAILPPPGLPECKVSPAGLAGRMGRALGVQDIHTNNDAFDAAFIVKGDDEVLVRRLWSRKRAQTMTLAFPTSRLECGGVRAMLLQPVIESVEQVETGIDLILELARSDPYGQGVLGDLPEAEVKHGDRFLEVELPGPSPIRIGPAEREGGVRTCARTVAIGSLPPGAETQVTALGATLEQTEQELRIWWPSIETDVRRLTAAADLLRQLASGPSLGVFR